MRVPEARVQPGEGPVNSGGNPDPLKGGSGGEYMQLLVGYILGIIDSEGSFSISIKRDKRYKKTWVIDPVFSLTQHEDSKRILEMLRDFFSVGRVVKKPGSKHLLMYIIDNLQELGVFCRRLEKYENFLISKRKNFLIFKSVVYDLLRKKHLSDSGFLDVIRKVFKLPSKKGRRKYSYEMILRSPLEQGSVMPSRLKGGFANGVTSPPLSPAGNP